jgi:tRNA dimethylallyltransferase
MWLASREPVTIISADSRQIYQGFDVGTAKPTRDERAAVPHRGVDIVPPIARYSAAAWAAAADRWIEDALSEARRPVVVGGTGLYLRALFEGLFEEPDLDPKHRRALEAHLAELSVTELRRWVEQLDPSRAHLGRTQLLRSIEIAMLAGRRLSELHAERPRVPRWRPRYLLVDSGPGLGERIARRVDEMFERGWAKEAQALMTTVPADAPAWKATGYEMAARIARGEISHEVGREAIAIATRQYAKRQRTWFRHQLPADAVTALDPLAPDWQSRVAAWSAQAGVS